MINAEKNISDAVPVFVPPRKRQTSKKQNGVQNYVDHIVCVQTNDRKYPISSSLEDLLSKTNQAGERKQLANFMKAASKTSIDCNPKKSSNHDIHLSIEDVIKTQSMCRKSPSVRTESLKTAAPTSRSEDNLDIIRTPNDTARSKKRVNILTAVDHPSSKQKLCSSTISIENEHGESMEDSNEVNLLNSKNSSLARTRSPDNYLTMTGTIKRGKKKGQCLDVQLNISRDELEKINSTALKMQQANDKDAKKSCCSLTSGVHILILSLLSLPFVIVITSIYAFYIGTITWYNMFNFFNEEKSYLHKLVMSPLLVIAYPIGIVLCTIGLAIYSGIVQISTKFGKWSNEIADIEKGFYGWLCNFLHLSDCSPYEVVILTELKATDETVPPNSSTEELSI
ncbi:uncharacterized protein LOC116342827 [Contarinia nasturtii]|uniref:uncharacterized protein LOC116342827 n=1 Tax=Contarinia nasturtii TaxID=265458 RepID=UPI0012D382F1|nr:uncharacterized protein LOC116342827 [Contarinia nasturtii]